ncbi:MAG: NAD(P)-dependent oxidoreductase [Phycisphaerales bacterium]|nr:NAD(P)-dependent oxidoreductase [Phycisphaerales bacterium]
MKIALTGVSGFIGSHIARRAAARGDRIIGLVRESSVRAHVVPFVERFVVGDQADESVWSDLFDGADAVVHNSMDWQALRDPDLHDHLQRNLAASIQFLIASRPRPFALISSVAVHHDMRPRWQGEIDEDHPLRPSSMYGACKAALEAHCWAEHYGGTHGPDNTPRHVVALRPAAVYGPIMVPHHRSWSDNIFEAIKQGEAFDKPGGGKFVHVEDVADAVLASLREPEASAQAFNLADCYARWTDVAQFAADALGTKAQITHVSPEQPQNMFDPSAARTVLCVGLSRGHEGLREHMRHLAGAGVGA